MRIVEPRRAASAGLCWLGLLLSAGCGSGAADPTVVPSQSWGSAVAAVECAQIFGCCDATERGRWGYSDEAQCRQMLGPKEQMNLDEVIATGWVTYNGKAARSCLDESLAAGCTSIQFNATVGIRGPSCPNVTHGTGKLGAPCEDLDFICESSNCLPGPGTCGPPRGCPTACDPGQFCDGATSACAPVKPDGAACLANDACQSPSVCRTGVCGPPLPDGAPCSLATDCAGGSCVHSSSTSAACGPPLPDGSPCTVTTDCANGGCTGAVGSAVCGPRFCDGM